MSHAIKLRATFYCTFQTCDFLTRFMTDQLVSGSGGLRRVDTDVDVAIAEKQQVSSMFQLKLSSRLKLLRQALGHRCKISTFGILR